MRGDARGKGRIPGFTLAELLIAVGLLGVIATFTIPKVLTAQTDRKYNAMAKEAAAMVSEAYQAARQKGTVNSQRDMTPYFNYVKLETALSVDYMPGGTQTCDGAITLCYRLHNGGVLYFFWNREFCAGSNDTAIEFYFDPDGVASAIKDVEFFLFRNGKIRTWASIPYPTAICGPIGPYSGTYGANSAWEPAWFRWN